MLYHLYLIARLSDGRGYIGLTKQSVERRVQQHIKNDTVGIGAALRAEGIDKFVWAEIDTADSLIEAKRLERHYINALNALEPRGYNRKPGGDGHTPSRRLRHRIPKAQKREPIFYEIDCPDVDPDVIKAEQYLADSFSII